MTVDEFLDTLVSGGIITAAEKEEIAGSAANLTEAIELAKQAKAGDAIAQGAIVALLANKDIPQAGQPGAASPASTITSALGRAANDGTVSPLFSDPSVQQTFLAASSGSSVLDAAVAFQAKFAGSSAEDAAAVIRSVIPDTDPAWAGTNFVGAGNPAAGWSVADQWTDPGISLDSVLDAGLRFLAGEAAPADLISQTYGASPSLGYLGGTQEWGEWNFKPDDAERFGQVWGVGEVIRIQQLLREAGYLTAGAARPGEWNDACASALTQLLTYANSSPFVSKEGLADFEDSGATRDDYILDTVVRVAQFQREQRTLPEFVAPVRRKPTWGALEETVTDLFLEQFGERPSAGDLSMFASFLSAQYDAAAGADELAAEAEYVRQNRASQAFERGGVVTGFRPTTEQMTASLNVRMMGNEVPTIDPEGMVRRKFREVFAGQIGQQEAADAQANRRNSLLGSIFQMGSFGNVNRLGA